MNSNKIGVTTRSMSKCNSFLTPKTAGKSDERVFLTSGQSTSPMNHKPSEAASDELAVRSKKLNLLQVRKPYLAQLESRSAQQKQNLVDRVRLVPVHLLT